MSNAASADGFKIKCQECRRAIRVHRSMCGKSGKCPGCGAIIKIPAVDSNSASNSKNESPLSREVASSDSQNSRSPNNKGLLGKHCQSSGWKIQLVFTGLFCLAAFLFAPFSRGIDRSALNGILFGTLGAMLGIIPWTAFWFVFRKGSMEWRASILMAIVGAFVISLLGGWTLAKGVGPISVGEAVAGAPAILLLFLVAQIPVWLQQFKCKLVKDDLDLCESKENLSPFEWGAVTILVILAIVFAFGARFPGKESVINWIMLGPFVALSSLLTMCIAIHVVLKVENRKLMLGFGAAHWVFLALLVFLAGSMDWVRGQMWRNRLMVVLGSHLFAIYLPLIVMRFQGFRLTRAASGSKQAQAGKMS